MLAPFRGIYQDVVAAFFRSEQPDYVILAAAKAIRQINQPDGTPRKLLEVSKINALGWQAKIGLLEGLRETYRWFVATR